MPNAVLDVVVAWARERDLPVELHVNTPTREPGRRTSATASSATGHLEELRPGSDQRIELMRFSSGQRPGGASTLTVGIPPPARAITAIEGSSPGLLSRWMVWAGTCTKSPGLRLDVALEALALEPEHPGDDVQARLVDVVVVPARHGARGRDDAARPQQRLLERQRARHPGRGVGLDTGPRAG